MITIVRFRSRPLPRVARTWRFGVLASAAAALACASPCFGEERATVVETQPDYALVGTGLLLFAGPYIASVVVAAESNHSGDEHLYIPVVGPWLDLADRNCGPNDIACNNEGMNKALLIGNGILQGVGVVTAVAGFLFPEKRVVSPATTTGARVKVLPIGLGRGGYGLGAIGTF
jgi:hypothetical protein